MVSLAYNGFENQGAAALADALKVNSTLKELDIRLAYLVCVCVCVCSAIVLFSCSNNRIGTDGAIVLSRVLPINDTLKEFKVYSFYTNATTIFNAQTMFTWHVHVYILFFISYRLGRIP